MCVGVLLRGFDMERGEDWACRCVVAWVQKEVEIGPVVGFPKAIAISISLIY